MNTIILKEKIESYLQTNNVAQCHELAESIVTIVIRQIKLEEKTAREASAEFDRDRYADSNEGWASKVFTTWNGWTSG